MNNEELDHFIRRTHFPPAFSPSFQREVWARVSVAEEASWAARTGRWMESFLPVLGQPSTAVAAVMAMLLLGVGLGRIASPESDPVDLRSAYLVSIHPAMAAHFDSGE